MKTVSRIVPSTVLAHTFLTEAIAITIGLLLLNPLWEKHSPPFYIPKVSPPITAPVDGPFYLLNAEYGYRWDTRDPLSLWFHPTMAFLVRIMPAWPGGNYWFWWISIAFALGSMVLAWQVLQLYTDGRFGSLHLLPLLLLVPGGLGIATGNPEIPTLFFTSTLLLSVLRWHIWWLTALSAILAIMTKPNALYMVPVLLVYLAEGLLRQDNKLSRHAFLGATSILFGWVIWIIIVDWNSGNLGAYWNARTTFNQYIAGNFGNFFVELVRSFLRLGAIRDQIRYSTALLIPLVNIWVAGIVPLSRESHRYALAAGNLAMLVIALLEGNPNKIIVYTTTLPGHFPLYILVFQQLLVSSGFTKRRYKIATAVLLATYCLAMLLVYIIGTPLGWYY